MGNVLDKTELVDRRGAAPVSPLVLLKPGVGKPLFIVPGLAGIVIELAKLGQGIDSPKPVYVIRAKGFDGTEEPLDTVPDMVAYSLAHLRAMQPNGPYYLAGYSFGGIIAMEMARCLNAAGETVALLAFLDTFAHPQTFPKAAQRIMRLRSVIAPFRTKPPSEACALALASLTAMLSGGTDDWVRSRFAWLAPYVPEEGADPALRVYAAGLTAVSNYWPVRYPGRVQFFYTRSRNFGASPRRVWGRLLGGLTLHAVAGDHHSMLREHAPYLAAALSTALRHAHSRASSCGR